METENMNNIKNKIVIIVIAVGVAAVLWTATQKPKDKAANLPQNITSVDALEYCFTTNMGKEAAAFECLSGGIRSLLANNSPKKILEDAKTSTKASIAKQCHSLGHIVGQELYKQTGSVEKALELCSDACTFACGHGATVQAVITELGGEDNIMHLSKNADKDKVIEIGKKYCKSTGLCHAAGHTFFLLYRNYQQSLNICETISDGVIKEYCFRGVFMEGTGSAYALETIKGVTYEPPTDNNLGYPCNTVDEKYQHACLRYLPRFQRLIFARQSISDTNTVQNIQISECEKNESPKIRAACFEGFGFHYWQLVAPSPQDAITVCNKPKQKTDKQACMLGVVYTLTSFYLDEKGPNYCELIKDDSTRKICYQIVFQTSIRLMGKKKAAWICEKAAKSEICKSELNRYLPIAKEIPDFNYGLPMP